MPHSHGRKRATRYMFRRPFREHGYVFENRLVNEEISKRQIN
jgi:ribosomal protein L21E